MKWYHQSITLLPHDNPSDAYIDDDHDAAAADDDNDADDDRDIDIDFQSDVYI